MPSLPLLHGKVLRGFALGATVAEGSGDGETVAVLTAVGLAIAATAAGVFDLAGVANVIVPVVGHTEPE